MSYTLKRFFKSLLLLIISLQMYGQIDQIESLMTRRYLSCEDILYNVSYLIPEYYEKENKDTLQAIIKYWEDRCGISGELMRCKILLSIDDGTFNESLYNDNILNTLRSYERTTMRYSDKTVNWTYLSSYRYREVFEDRLDKFTIALAKKLLETKECQSVEKFFLRIYSNDFKQGFQMLDSDELNGTRIKELYLKEKRKYEQTVYFNSDVMGGIWIPQGNLEILGTHPFLGLRPGFKYKKITTGLAFGFRFIKSPNIYQVYMDDVIWDTDHFLGVFIGLDTSYEMLRLGKNSIDIIGGLAFDNIEALNDKKYGSNNSVKNISSLNLNIGLGYKFHFKNQRYLGLETKYNFVNYKNPQGTNLDGNVFTFNLIFGGIDFLN